MLQTYDERNADIVYWVQRRAAAPRRAGHLAVRFGGAGRRRGLGGAARLRRAHLRPRTRTWPGCAGRRRALGFAAIPDTADIVAAIADTLVANAMPDGVHIRLTLTRGVKVTSGMDPRLNQAGCTLIVLAEYKAPVYDTSGLRLITASIRRPGPDVLDPKIHHNNLLNSILAKMEANVAGADDALMLDGRGFVAETNATHLFAVDRRRRWSRRARWPARRASPGRPCSTLAPAARHPGRDARRLADRDVRRRRGLLHRHDGRDRRGHRDRRPGHRLRRGRPGHLRIAELYHAYATTHGTPSSQALDPRVRATPRAAARRVPRSTACAASTSGLEPTRDHRPGRVVGREAGGGFDLARTSAAPRRRRCPAGPAATGASPGRSRCRALRTVGAARRPDRGARRRRR